MRNIILLLISVFFTSCGPSFCDCIWGEADNEEACRSIYKDRFGTEDPSPIRIYSVKQGSCEDYYD